MAFARAAGKFFSGYLGEEPWDRSTPWQTGDQVTQDEDGFMFFQSRADDVIISAGYRIGPFEVESALITHPAVAEAAVVAARIPIAAALSGRSSRWSPANCPRMTSAGRSGPRQVSDGSVQVPAYRGLRRRGPEDGERQGQARAAARRSALRSGGELDRGS